MTVALQIRDVPDDVRDLLAAQARREGQSLQSYLLRMVEREARLLRQSSMFERTRELRTPMSAEMDPVAIIREGRDGGFETDRSS